MDSFTTRSYSYTPSGNGRGVRGGSGSNPCAAVAFGLLMFAGSIALLWWNEGISVERYETLSVATKEVVELGEPERPEAGDAGKLVHLTGKAVGEVLTDGEFGLSVPALRMRRKASMLQWVEHKKETKHKQGSQTVTDVTYSYKQEWKGSVVDSTRFNHPQGHENPTHMQYTASSWDAAVRIGDGFKLTRSLVGQIGGYQEISLDAKGASRDTDALAALDDGQDSSKALAARRLGDEVALTSSPAKIAYLPKRWYASKTHLQSYRPGEVARVGATEVSFEGVPSGGTYSILARQQRDGSLMPWKAKGGRSDVAVVKSGYVSASEMIAAEVSANTMRTWFLRGLGAFLVFLAISCILSPVTWIASFADFIPLLGPLFSGVVNMGVSVIAFTIAITVSFTTIGVAWLWHRPVLAGTLLIVAASTAFLSLTEAWKRRKQQ